VNTGKHDEQHMGYIVPEEAQLAKRQTVYRGGAYIFRSWANMLGRISRSDDKAKGKKRGGSKGDGM